MTSTRRDRASFSVAAAALAISVSPSRAAKMNQLGLPLGIFRVSNPVMDSARFKVMAAPPGDGAPSLSRQLYVLFLKFWNTQTGPLLREVPDEPFF